MCFIVWGTKQEKKFAGETIVHCPTCGKEKTMNITLIHTYDHLFWIIKETRSKEYVVHCPTCENTYEYDPADKPQIIDKGRVL